MGTVLARDKGGAVWQADRVIVHREQARLPHENENSRSTALSFFAGKPRSNRCPYLPVGAVLAREKGGAVWQADRVIVHREQARLPHENENSRFTALSFFAGKPRSNRCPYLPVGTVLARDKGGAVWQADRVIVYREQARLPH
ncbi:hypothetical protein IV01_18725 [Pseudomonas syringae]|uniref:Uncharacterized protein n=1 Tax=Pseudomonas syringae TaxID=317 RepID=A0A085VE75_PSESX|nr:hypothetical protein IV01_18725 [Pseudomonas syringae]